jgi:hypothetical protein
MKRIEIQMIEFDWVFKGERAKQFLAYLGSTDNLDLFTIPTIKYVIKYQWKFFKPTIFWKTFIPYMIYLTLFMLHVNVILNNKINEQDGLS